jgi:choline transport protein
MFGFSVILMCSWEVILSTASLGLGNGGSAGFLYTNLGTWLGFICVVRTSHTAREPPHTPAILIVSLQYASMGEQGSMAPTSGGAYPYELSIWTETFA